MSLLDSLVVEDLQLGVAIVLGSEATIHRVLQLAYERDFSIIPITDPATRKLEGWINVDELKELLTSQPDTEEDLSIKALASRGSSGSKGFKKFDKGRPYQVITPSTSLKDLSAFFSEQGARTDWALVTDQDRKFVLGIVTKEDLAKFADRLTPRSA